MSHTNGLSGLLSGDSGDVTLAKIGLFLCLSLFGLRLLAEQVLLVVIPVAGGSACALYLFTRRHEAQPVELPAIPRQFVGYLPAAVFLSLTALVLSVYTLGGRSVISHLFTGIVGATLLAQFFFVETPQMSTRFLLVQTLVAAIVVRFSALFATSGFTGVDIWTHIPVYVGGIVETGSLVAIAEFKYVMAPIYHLNGAAAAIVFGSPRAGVFLTVGTLLAVSAVLLYSTARLLLPARWAALAMVLFVFSDQAIRWSIHLIPTSLGLVFFLGLLYALTKLYYRPDTRLFGLLFLFGLAIVFTHQVSTAVVLLTLGVAAAVSVGTVFVISGPTTAQRQRAKGLSSVFTATTAITLLSWANTPFSGDFIFLWRMLDVLGATVFGEAGFLNLAGDGGGGGAGGAASQGQPGLVGELVPFIEWFGFAVLLAITVIGGILLLRRAQPTELTYTYLCTFAAMFLVVYGLSLFGIRTFMPGRWLAFMHAPMVIIGSYGLYYIAQHAPRRVFLIVVLIVAVGYPVTMVTAEKATLDAPAFEDEYPRFSYTDAEIGAMESISEYRPPEVEQEIGTDHPYRSLYDRVGGYDIPDMIVEDGQAVRPDTTVSREYQVSGPATVFEVGEVVFARQSNEVISEDLCSSGESRLYTNDHVTLCTQGGDSA